MRFETPYALLLSALPVALIIYNLVTAKSNALSYSDVRLLRVQRRLRTRLLWLPSATLTLGLFFAVIALARPQWEITRTNAKAEGIAIQLVLDISSSMDIDIEFGNERISRLTAAKQVIHDFVLGNGTTLGGRPNDLIGVQTFARYADTLCPLTMGHDALVHLTDQLEVNDRPNEDGTAFGDASALASARLTMLDEYVADPPTPGQGVKSKIIILLTDGENNCGQHLPLEAAGMAKEWNLKIYTISLGNKPTPRTQKTKTGTVVVPERLTQTDQLLSRMAEMTGGIFRTAYDFDSLQKVYDEIDALEKTDVTTTPFTEYEDRCVPFLLVAICLASISILLGQTVLRSFP